ncbi:P-loop containing nucleoside triphosphate hydrolase protein [Fomitiporia mediterranea MF3/22]|uniref:P-loop containing nucleoside triphosphate hydrolase protein n=1 Tax=Fomitiporia mediterranea (strain MF3/22) TaxID=694068 RepID=UPI0004407ABC|nr:P-loop containing nucleoside triphosphate hydrolase protein [Fomitiporia mediterranea MF3/22]EJD07726.1 P-loop containing nucleoside triphosphate hydrolase protein [Fomitiporia mediterranea MF3/22]
MPPTRSRKSAGSSSSSGHKAGTPEFVLGSSAAASKQKPVKPLFSVRRPPAFNTTDGGKRKEKPKSETVSLLDGVGDLVSSTDSQHDDRLWIDVYEPQSEAELAVHKKKVEDVRRWLQEAFEGGNMGKLKKYRRILVLTGPAGTAKTTTVRVLSKELGFNILEWRSTVEESYVENDTDWEGLNEKFEAFLARAAANRPLVGRLGQLPSSSSQTCLPSSSSTPSTSSPIPNEQKQVILLEDLPNVLHQPTQVKFHAALESFVTLPNSTPLIIVISDASTRGEVRDERLAQGGGGRFLHDNVDIRTVLPPSLVNGPYVTQISFNPIAPTLMLRALQEMLSRYYSDVPQSIRLTKDDLNTIVQTSNGDIRSAAMALQFSCVLETSKSKAAKGKKKGSRALMELITRRERALALFHLMGKVLYNKRKGDPLASSASAKDRHHEQELDLRLKDPSPLPPWFSEHERRASRVDVDGLYADSPIDTGLFALYVHQNYSQFCDDVSQCRELSDWLSWIDSSGGEHWYQTNPHQFHMLTLGALHSLPSPVTRRGQKMYKPEFFDVLKKTHDAEDAVLDVWTWLQDSGSPRWSKNEIALELGSVLKAHSRGVSSGTLQGITTPSAHSAFSTLVFASSSTSKASTLNADGNDEDAFEVPPDEDSFLRAAGKMQKEEVEGNNWLSDDDIEEF